jgi:Putative MetA-pathway of phenol degradation
MSMVATLASLLLGAEVGTAADAPAFDRPGIAFSTATIPPGSFSFEFGIPDFVHSSDAGSTSTLYSLSTNIRAGLAQNFELQLATPLVDYQRTQEGGASDSATGVGDSTLSVKVALPSRADRFAWAALAGVTFATGEQPFTGRKPQYRLATAISWEFNDTYSTGFYVNLNYFDGATGYTLSPNLNFALRDHLVGYLELGYFHVPGSPDSTVAGGGLAYMVTPTVQLDLSVDVGVSTHAPDVQGGFGVSIFLR